MKNFILKVLYLLYGYYNSGSTKNIAYESALFALLGIVILNVFAILFFLDLSKVLGILDYDSRWLQYISAFIFIVLPGYLILMKTFTKEDVLKVEIKAKPALIGRFFIFAYIVLSIILLFVVIRLKRGEFHG